MMIGFVWFCGRFVIKRRIESGCSVIIFLLDGLPQDIYIFWRSMNSI